LLQGLCSMSSPNLRRAVSPGGEIRVLQLGLVRSAMLLVGLAFENLLKGVAVSRRLLIVPHSSLSDPQEKLKWKTSLRGATGHDLLSMSHSLNLSLTVPQEELLKRTSAYVKWAGRYPSANELTVTIEAHRNSELRLALPDDRHVADQLAAYLRAQAGC
jgi:hypothetical protein